jgi:hypothetical protein
MLLGLLGNGGRDLGKPGALENRQPRVFRKPGIAFGQSAQVEGRRARRGNATRVETVFTQSDRFVREWDRWLLRSVHNFLRFRRANDAAIQAMAMVSAARPPQKIAINIRNASESFTEY